MSPASRPALEPGIRMDEEWEDRVRGLSAADASTLLLSADEVRDRDEEGARLATGAYTALLERLDPRNDRDAPRVSWLLSRLTGPDPKYRPLAEAARAAPDGTELRALAETTLGLCLSQEAPRASLDHFHTALKYYCGTGRDREIAILINVGARAIHLGREFEALVVYRRALRLARERGARQPEWQALHGLAVASIDTRQWDHFERLVAEEEALIPKLDGPLRAQASRWLHSVRADAALTRGDYEACLAHAERAHGAQPDAAPDWHPLISSHALLKLGRLAEAREFLARGEALQQECQRAWDWRVPFLTTYLLVMEGDPGPAAEYVLAFLDALESPDGRRAVGSGRRQEMAVELARAMEGVDSTLSVCWRALDVAGAANLERLREVHWFLGEFPFFAAPDGETREIMSHYQTWLYREQGDVLAVVGKLFLDAVRAGDPVARSLTNEGDLVRACAWCRRLCGPDGRWLPVGHFLPPDGPIGLTHGLCDDCNERINPGGADS